MKNKKIKILLIMVVLLTLGYFAFQFLLIKAGEHVLKTEILNAEEIAGKTDNNSYGIRNDVYDVIQKEYFEKMNLSEDDKNLILNLSYIDQQLISNYYNENYVLEQVGNVIILIECGYQNNQKKVLKSVIKHDSPYVKSFINTIDRKNAKIFYERIYSLNQQTVRDYVKKNKDCEKFKKFLNHEKQ